MTAVAISEADIAGLVTPDRVHRRVYTDTDIFELELERIRSSRSWKVTAPLRAGSRRAPDDAADR